ncbi:FadR/GntR family transcriptional regulator [Pelagibius sp. Alg239-R121]|uniref:FadR/GntR family transcriptional regulator n=1 Tax=Pelagibius sp. Alg239-R121 TaxID=2993448 RepID=UPI0024A7511E|nr:FadR/GntR family transcriptional regulator [Pelagibius sp. Alg239-R121]
MSIVYSGINKEGLSTQIADAIRTAIMEGRLVVEERLPSETELAERFGVSRPTVREALKRLAAQNLIRTQRGPTGGAFVNRLSWSEAHDALVTTSTLLVGMNDIPFEDVVEARFTLEAACVPLAARRREDKHLEIMRREIAQQRIKDETDEGFCASDVRFHRALTDAAGNPVLSFQMAGVIEAMQPLMNMVTYRMRDRTRIADLHSALTDAIEGKKTRAALKVLEELSAYTLELMAARRKAREAKS